jgi:hypothetical protein
MRSTVHCPCHGQVNICNLSDHGLNPYHGIVPLRLCERAAGGTVPYPKWQPTLPRVRETPDSTTEIG